MSELIEQLNKIYELGKEQARNEVLEYIKYHAEHEVDITPEDIANEVEYLQRKDLRDWENGKRIVL